MLADGAAGIGWKVGFGAPASLELMAITAPLLGFLTDATVRESGSIVETAGWTRGVVEFEVAVYMGADLAAGASDDEARAAVAAVGASIELADINLPIAPESVEGIVAGDIFHAGVILGAPDPNRAGLDIDGLLARVFIDGHEHASTASLEAITGSYPLIVRTVADTLAANGLVLREGEVIITGSVIPPVAIEAGREFTFLLDPFGPISVVVD